MRIGIVSPALRLGGREVYSRTLAERLAAAGNLVEFVESREHGAWAENFRARGFSVRSLPLPVLRSPAGHARRLSRVLAGYDAVIVNDDALARAALGRVPAATVAIVVIHGDFDGQYETALGRFDDCDAVVGVSDAIVERAAARLTGRSVRLLRIGGGVRVPEVPRQREIRQGAQLVLIFVGRISDWDKGVFLLPAILKGVLDAGVDARLTVVGGGPDSDELMKRFSAAGLAERVEYAGVRDGTELDRVLEHSDVLLLPSRLEGFPLAPLEAMARGTVPVVTLLAGSTDRMIVSGVHGVLIPAGDVDGFSAAIVALARDRMRLVQLSLAGRLRVREEFSEELMGRAYLTLIGELKSVPRTIPRSGRVDLSVLGELPHLPSGLLRPARRLLKIAGVSRRRKS